MKSEEPELRHVLNRIGFREAADIVTALEWAEDDFDGWRNEEAARYHALIAELRAVPSVALELERREQPTP